MASNGMIYSYYLAKSPCLFPNGTWLLNLDARKIALFVCFHTYPS